MRFVIPNEAETIIKNPFLFCVFLKRKNRIKQINMKKILMINFLRRCIAIHVRKGIKIIRCVVNSFGRRKIRINNSRLI
jgi:hypothetical protein